MTSKTALKERINVKRILRLKVEVIAPSSLRNCLTHVALHEALATNTTLKINVKRILTTLLLFTSLFALTSCEHIEISNDDSQEDASSSLEIAAPLSYGQGTMESPLTVKQLQDNCEDWMGEQTWIIGYAVGETYRSLSNACFTPPFEYTSNILISSDRNCSDVSHCMPVELNTTKLKGNIALSNNPHHHLHCVMLQGTVQRFFGTIGLRNLTHYHWLPEDFTLPYTSPSEWEELEVEY